MTDKTTTPTNGAGVPPAPPEAHQKAALVMCSLCSHARWLPGAECVRCACTGYARAAAVERYCPAFKEAF